MSTEPPGSIDLLGEFKALRDEIVYRLGESTLLMTFNVSACGVFDGYGIAKWPFETKVRRCLT